MAQQEWLYGIHTVTTLLLRDPMRIIELWVLKDRDDKRIQRILALAAEVGLSVQYVQRQALDKRAQDQQHQGVAVRAKKPAMWDENSLDNIVASNERPLFLVLDGITDPHNLGACLRTADAAGVHAVIVPKDRASALNATARKVACGAAEVIPFIQVTNLARTLKHLQTLGIWVVGTAGEAPQSIYQTSLDGALAWVMGAEGKGMRRLTKETCDLLVNIPMAGEVSSVNVSVASGICLFETVRQRTG